jgi:hypothetical protein
MRRQRPSAASETEIDLTQERRFTSGGVLRRAGAAGLLSLAMLGAFSTAAVSAPPGLKQVNRLSARGGPLLKLFQPRLNTNQSSNWFGYNQGALEQGGKLFNSVTGYWTVPTATQHTKGKAEASSDWIGIGGGCVDSGCTVTDPTLIQTGTEQDVSAGGKASYYAWYELVPAPSLEITGMKVSPGNRMYASLAAAAGYSDLWTITIKDTTTGQSYSTTLPYPSTHATAEWIEETPLEIGTNAGFAALPNLTNPNFDLGTVNGANPKLKASEQMQLVSSSGAVIGSPSNPDSDLDGFGDCAWATSCSAPGS